MRYTTRRGGPLARWTAAAVGLALVASCDVTSPLPVGARSLTPLPQYARWWSMVEQCSGLVRPVGHVSWYVVESGSFSVQGRMVDGLYAHGPDRIILAGPVVNNGPLVRHEMLHALIGDLGRDDHPAEYFLRRCAGFVECRPGCVATAGERGSVPVAQTQPTTVLQITIEVDSLVRRGAPDYGYAHVMVRARNPLTVPILVFPHAFALDVDPPPGALLAAQYTSYVEIADPRAGYFAPGETKSRLFDIFLPVNGNVVATLDGLWTVRGGLGTIVTPPSTFRYAP